MQQNRGSIYVDADAYPVKQEIYKLTERHDGTAQEVANDIISLPVHPLIKQMVAGESCKAADNWKAE